MNELRYRPRGAAGDLLKGAGRVVVLAGLNPDPPARQAARDTLDVLAATIRRGVRAGVFPPRSARRLTLAAWALVHGLVSLELDGKLPPASRPASDYQAILRATVTGWQHTSPR